MNLETLAEEDSARPPEPFRPSFELAHLSCRVDDLRAVEGLMARARAGTLRMEGKTQEELVDWYRPRWRSILQGVAVFTEKYRELRDPR